MVKSTPASRSLPIRCMDCGRENHSEMKPAVIAPISGMAVSSSGFAAMRLSRSPKWAASTFAAFCPTCRMPKAQSRRARPALLLFSMALIRFAADFSPIRSSRATFSASR